MANTWHDVRYGWRQLRRTPGFTAAAVLTLALGIGANSAIFSVVRAVLLQPLPYADPERLVTVWNRLEKTNFPKAPVAAPDFTDYRSEIRLFEDLAATDNVSEGALTGDFEAEQIRMASVTANFFSLLGVEPLLGRVFAPDDGTPLPANSQAPNAIANAPPSALVLSHELWTRRFGGDPGVLGRSLRVSGRPFTVVGVLPPGFELLMPPDAGMPTNIHAWTPLRFDLAGFPRDNGWLRVIGRLRPGVTVAQAQAEMDALAARQREQFQYHENVGLEISVLPMHRDVVGRVRPVLLALLGAVGFVLMIACANVANLLLARAAARGREMAVRTALGASGGRLLRQMLTESAVLAVLGAGAGLVVAWGGTRLLVALKPSNLPRLPEIGIDGTVLGFTLAIATLSGLAFGIVPALGALSAAPAESLRARDGGAGSLRARNALIVAEVALSLILLIGAGLMLRSFAGLARVRPGFDPEGVLTYSVSLPLPSFQTQEARTRFLSQMEDRVATLPGVRAVGSVFPIPLGGRFWTGPYGGRADAEDTWTKNEANFRIATPGYFSAMGTRVLGGRAFTPADNQANRTVAVVDETLAKRLFPGRSAVGEQVGVDLFGNKHWLEIVGVVEPIRHDDLRQDGRETIYFPHHLFPWPPMTVAVRSTGDPTVLLGSVREEVRGLTPDLPLYNVRTLNEAFSLALANTRFTMILIAVFAGVALILAMVGLYGVIAYTVRQRTREIGIRMALGARQGSILRMVVGGGLRLILAGVALGILAAYPLTRTVQSLLFGVTPGDPLTYALLASLLVGVALVACYLPAQRAARLNPMESLRAE
jgi:putative ABC transport system permease protein